MLSRKKHPQALLYCTLMKQIFLVEDDQDIRELIEHLLISEHYHVRSFPTATAFREGISGHHPDLILMDIMLPDGNGLELCRDLYQNYSAAHIPVVLMSANNAEYQVRREPCVKDFIAKPFDIDDLITRVARQLN
jgi:DNA-binding response OmpR family regulator